MACKLLVEVPNEDKILELDADKVCLVTDTFSKADMYLESETKQGYIKLNAPGLYNFQLPEPGCLNDVITQYEDDSTLTDNWTKEDVDEINLIRTQDGMQLGHLQRDTTTGEMYMLFPLEIDLLLSPDPSCNMKQPAEGQSNISSVDSAITLAQSDDAEEDASQTTLTDTPKPNENQVQLLHMEEERET
ncbi:uncharacterized protein LOC117779580 isoform X1 [Drosophila innubila]|uniref:uncharacterized protein LOC117779580 isoform X1 n=1 Tax=Drosophila innubila TaxID=198719 RepID=UPI00148C7F9B|nr:uncharacterized protein LOC117779580 isoform X1 [Drosophila innubila]